MLKALALTVALLLGAALDVSAQDTAWRWRVFGAEQYTDTVQLETWIREAEACSGLTRPEGDLLVAEVYVILVQVYNPLGYDDIVVPAGFYSSPLTNAEGMHFVAVAKILREEPAVWEWTMKHELMHYVTAFEDGSAFDWLLETCWGPEPKPQPQEQSLAPPVCDGQDHNLFSERCRDTR